VRIGVHHSHTHIHTHTHTHAHTHIHTHTNTHTHARTHTHTHEDGNYVPFFKNLLTSLKGKRPSVDNQRHKQFEVEAFDTLCAELSPASLLPVTLLCKAFDLGLVQLGIVLKASGVQLLEKREVNTF